MLALTISGIDFWAGVVTGALLLGGFLTVGPTVLFPSLNRPSSQ